MSVFGYCLCDSTDFTEHQSLDISCGVLLSPISSEENAYSEEIFWGSGVKKGKKEARELGIPASRLGGKIDVSK